MIQHMYDTPTVFKQGSMECPQGLGDAKAWCQSPPEIRYRQGKRGQLTISILSGASFPT